jgi:NTP pyrophosphatase (non-canonical NTP hydrolase)
MDRFHYPYVVERTEAFGALLREARLASGEPLGVRDLAGIVGVPYDRYLALESGDARPTERELFMLVGSVVPDGGAALAAAHLLPAIAIRPALRRFAEVMELKLRAREHRGDWSESTLDQALARVMMEAGELAEAITVKRTGQDLPSSEVRDEATDVALEGFIAWDLARGPLRSRDRGRAFPQVTGYVKEGAEDASA